MMKKIARITLVVAIMLGTSMGYANDTLDSTPIFSKELRFNNVKKGHQLTIKKTTGKTIYSEVINTAGFYTSNFDLESLKDGLYTIELSKDFEINIKTFAVASHKVTFIENTEKTVFKPLIRLEAYKVLISKLNLDNTDPIGIKIYFENELIYSESVHADTILNRVYGLRDDISGNYHVVLNTNGRVYKNSFKI